MPSWLIALAVLLVLAVSLGLLAWLIESWLKERSRLRDFRRWNDGVLNLLAAPGSSESRLGDMRRLQAIVDARLRRLGRRAPSLRSSLEQVLYLRITQPEALRRRIKGGCLPSTESIKALLERDDLDDGEAAAPADRGNEGEASAAAPTVAFDPSTADGSGVKQEDEERSLLRKGLKLGTENSLVVTVVGGLLVIWIAAWIGIGESGGSPSEEGGEGAASSQVVDQLTLQKNLTHVDLEEADVRGKYLRGKIMREANLFEAKLQETDLTKAVLTEANLRGARLTETVFVEARLQGARFEGAVGTDAYFDRATAAGVKLGEVNLPRANFVSARLPHASMVEAEMPNSFFQEADLRWVEASKVELPNARLEDARLYEADLFDANLRGAQLYEADLRSADLSSADLREANLCRADLRGATLREAQLQGAVFDGRTHWPTGFDFEANGATTGRC
jgi:uncharacterized protein YjbI with pentapeptide repeats